LRFSAGLVDAISEPFTRRASHLLGRTPRLLNARAVGSRCFAARGPPAQRRRVTTGDTLAAPQSKNHVMNTTLVSTLRAAAFAATLSALPVFAFAKNSGGADRPQELLASHGSVPVAAAGPYVEIGTFQIQVAVKLGQPTARLTDGRWLYSRFRVEDSDASGSLLVRFTDGRVSELSLVTTATAVALQKTDSQVRVAERK
jgi:hypothetical protein